MTDLALQNTFLVSVVVAGRQIGHFMTFAGGDVSNDAQTDRPDGRNPISIPGPPGYAPVTVTRTFNGDNDTADLLAFLDNAARIGSPMTVGRSKRDVNGNAKGKGRTYVGILIRSKGPDTDHNSTDKATLELEMQVSGVA